MNNSKVILITGCSSGFGLITAARLAKSGHRVIATMRDTSKKSALLSEVQKRDTKLDIKPLDVTDKDSVNAAIQSISEDYGYIDVLINNAGCGIGGAFEDLADEEIRQVMETNFFGVQNVTRAAIPLMRPRKNGKIINISSISGLYALPMFGAYNASKWALEGFSESLRYELQFFGIDVLLVEPGRYKTEIFKKNLHLAKNHDNKNSPHYELSQHIRKLVTERLKDCHKDNEDVAEHIEKLIHAKNPPFRSQPDIEAKVFLLARKILPFRLFSFILNKKLFKRFKK
ncbi:MAG: SDR family NAD(P)-dependent oxidoreductase [Candidatus Omnitrophica bacterium]|nr:SDR family NAD(P)-dependent oxidoreductase [Candidatus Omnitrophota bacterium]